MFREFKSCGWEELWRVFSLKSCGQDLQLFLEQGFPTTHGAIYHGQYRDRPCGGRTALRTKSPLHEEWWGAEEAFRLHEVAQQEHARSRSRSEPRQPLSGCWLFEVAYLSSRGAPNISGVATCICLSIRPSTIHP